MATERVERELRRRLRELLGDVAGMALIEKFPPRGWADLPSSSDLQVERILSRFEVFEHRMTATLRAELNAAITAQTRSIIFGMLGAMAVVGGLSLAMTRLAG